MTKEELQAIHVHEGERSTVDIHGEIPFVHLEKHRAAAIKDLGKNMTEDGFRKGHIPEQMVIERIGEMALLTEMAERALRDVYPEIIKEHELDVIGYPNIEITKLAKGNPLGFKASVAVLPPVTLPDHKELAKKQNLMKESDEVTDNEVEEQIKEVLRQKAAYERLQKKAAAKQNAEKTDAAVDLPTPETVDADEDEKEPPLPELTDELVKTLGQPGQFVDVDDFKAKLREHLSIQKRQDIVAKHRAAITDAIIDETKVDLPGVLIDAEINQMFAQMTEDLTRAGLTMEGYLEHIKKTKEDLRKEWAPSAEKRAKLQLVLNAIAEKEHIHADHEEVDRQVMELLKRYPDADKDRVHTYVHSMLTNEAVMQMLEAQT